MGKKVKLFGIQILSIEDTSEETPVLTHERINDLRPFIFTGCMKFLALCRKDGFTSVKFVYEEKGDLIDELQHEKVDVVTAFIFLTILGEIQDQKSSYSIAMRSKEYADEFQSKLEQLYVDEQAHEREALIGLERIKFGVWKLCNDLFNEGREITHQKDIQTLKDLFSEEDIQGPILRRLGFWVDLAA